jgi:solute carrier family 25 (mitochondrial uncoupling protein), member 8/9
MLSRSVLLLPPGELLTIPLDTAKVRLQLQSGSSKYSGLLGTVRTIAKEEGVASLWKGVVPGLHRQCLFGGLRIGMYDPVKRFYVGENHVGEIPLHLKIAAGLTTGALGIMVASPTDLVKVRMQSEGKLAAGAVRKYPSAVSAYGIIAREEGLLGLWKGLGPNIGRNAVINAAELASYDQVKEGLLATGIFKDNVVTHLLSGMGAGFIAVCVGSPVDVVKSRVMGDKVGKYTGVVNCFVKTFTEDGLLAFYKGFIPNFARLGSWNVAMFLTLEQVKALMTKDQ